MGRDGKRRGALASLGMLVAWLSALALSAFALRGAGFRFRWEDGASERVAGGATGRLRGPETPGSGSAPGSRAPLNEGALRATGTRDLGEETFIDFETHADGTPTCESCPVGDEFRALGVRFSFRSWTADARYPYLLDARSYLPEGAAGPHAVASALQERGLEVGVIRMDFPAAPGRVVFDLTGPDLIDPFHVTAWTAEGPIDGELIDRDQERTFHASGGGVFRHERVTVESAIGIDRVELDGWGPPGHLLLIDNLSIGDYRSPRPEAR